MFLNNPLGYKQKDLEYDRGLLLMAVPYKKCAILTKSPYKKCNLTTKSPYKKCKDWLKSRYRKCNHCIAFHDISIMTSAPCGMWISFHTPFHEEIVRIRKKHLISAMR